MENTSEALYIAFAIMVFALALTLTFTSFSSLRATASSIIERDETVDLAKDSSGNYIYYIKGEAGSTNRIVGMDTIIPSMYRAYKENYKIIIKFKNNEPDITLTSVSGSQKNYYIDLRDENKSTQLQARNDLDQKLKDGLYNKLKNKKFIEELGQYYIEDENLTNKSSEILDVNRTLKRVITYTEQ